MAHRRGQLGTSTGGARLMNIRVLIVDDEALARGRIRKLLVDEPGLEIVGECANGPDAIAFIREQRPDLVFLDVQMPEVSGFDVLRALPPDIWPAIIFVTAHDQHAVQAFEVHALDYLLKPFTQGRLLEALERARQHLQSRDTSTLNQQLASWLKSASPQSAYLNRIAVKSGNQTMFRRVEDVDYIESAANYAVLQVGGQNHVLRETLTNLEAKLPPRSFLRISRSIIVNLDRIKAIQSGPGGEDLVLLQNGRQLLMTRSARELQQKLQYSLSSKDTPKAP
jgi:two-component system LytT family response regulator